MLKQATDYPAAKDLDQGDLLVTVLRPGPPTRESLHYRDGPRVETASKEQVAAGHANLRVMVKLERLGAAMVLSNSCDNTQTKQIVLAPVAPFKFQNPSAADGEKWRELSALATGGGGPRRFYLPAEPALGLERQEVLIADQFTVADSYLDRCQKEAGTKRVATLSEEALRHFRWALNNLHSRNAREDFAWPSVEDLQLKRAWLAGEVVKGSGFRQRYGVQLEEVERALEALGIPIPKSDTGTGA